MKQSSSAVVPPPQPTAAPTIVESMALVYLALPTVVFLYGWIAFPFGWVGALVVASAVFAIIRRPVRDARPLGMLLVPVVGIAASWTVLAGVGHWVYANTDWIVRDAVLVDLVRDHWPVFYRIDGNELVLRAPIGFFLPAALVGKAFGILAATQALLVWTFVGVALTFVLMLRDRPTPAAATIRLAVFIAFSGMDIVGTFAHYNPHRLGDHLEWWAFLFQYSSQTTQLFWVPNHALPGWIAIAWLLGQAPHRLSTTTAILFVVLTPLWSPLTALGIAPIVAMALVHWARLQVPRVIGAAILDWRMLAPIVVCAVLVYPYLVAGSGQVSSGSSAAIRWVGEDIVPRYIEFVLFEFVGIAALLLMSNPRDPVLWAAIAVLLALPTYRFGPANDLAMRASIPALTLLAIQCGRWLSTPATIAQHRKATVALVLLLGIGAVTPLMEFARAVTEPVRSMNERASVPDVTRGAHYLASADHSWLRRFLKPWSRTPRPNPPTSPLASPPPPHP